MHTHDWTRLWHYAQMDVPLLQAFYVNHAYPRHAHDYYVVCVIERGLQTFSYQGEKYFTPPGGIILINPGIVHTGEPADTKGFQMTALYPSAANMQAAAEQLTGRHQPLPYFPIPLVDYPTIREQILAMVGAVAKGASPLECESRFTLTMAQLVKSCAQPQFTEERAGREQRAVRQTREHIEALYAEGITLTELAQSVALSPYHLLRVFRAEVGMPPYAYLESVRIRHAQRLIEAGRPLADIAAEVGFSSQSHMTNRFKRIIGATPGQYALGLKS